MLGGVLGLLIAAWSMDALKVLVPETIPADLGIDLRILIFTAGISILTGVVFGLAPALVATRLNLNEAMKEGGMRTGIVSARHRLRSGLVVSELALSLILLIGAGLLTRSFLLLLEVNPGFNPHNVLTAEVSLPFTASVLSDQRRQATFFTQVLERIKSLPGVKSAGATTHPPLKMFDRLDSGLNIEGHAPVERVVSVSAVSSGYFRTMGIRLLKGRDFSEQDAEGRPSVVIINESFARLAFPNEEPVGKRIGGSVPPQLTIVGVVSDVKNLDLDREIWPEMYWPYLQRPSPFMTLVIHSDSDPSNLAAAVRAQVLAVDKNQPVFDIQTMEQLLSASVAPRRFRMLLLGVFAGVALVLAAVGIYGVMAYSVGQRTHEIGVRMALGAMREDVLSLVLGQGLKLTAIGVAIGVVVAPALTRLLSSLLYDVKPTDPLTFIAVSLLLTAVALLASYIPARRATKVDPMVALRYE
jgi:putative ABC transport system permease protein